MDDRQLAGQGQRHPRPGVRLAVVDRLRAELAVDLQGQYCPGCTVTVKSITATTNSQLASDTSANLLSNPNATYYYTEFEDSLDPTVQGIQQSNKTDIALSVAGGSVDGLGRLKSGAVVKAVVAVDQAYAGWALTDEILRMATKAAPVAETFPSRLFTAQNIGSIKVTTAAQASGAWFGDTSYQSAFEKLWGSLMRYRSCARWRFRRHRAHPGRRQEPPQPGRNTS